MKRHFAEQAPILPSVSCNLCRFEHDSLLVSSDPDGAILVDRSPLLKGHLLVVSKEHVPSVEDLPASTRQRILARAELARGLAGRIAGREALIIEHGRSPTCGDQSCSCHAHLHVVPVDAPQDELRGIDFLSAQSEVGESSYLSISTETAKRGIFVLKRPVRHASRTVAAMVATENGIRWNPLMGAPATACAHATLRAARALLGELKSKPKERQPARHTRDSGMNPAGPIIAVTGPTGSGKTTVGAHLAQKLGVPAIELGVILRLVALDQYGTEGRVADRLWRWSRKGRIDFDGASLHRLAAAVPRLDGGGYELPMWTDVEAAELAAIAQREDVQEVLSAIAERVVAASGGVIVGRVPPRLEGIDQIEIALNASPRERARRKRAQLAKIGLNAGRHDWFSPRQGGSAVEQPGDEGIDTTHLGVNVMCNVAERLVRTDQDDGQLRAS